MRFMQYALQTKDDDNFIIKKVHMLTLAKWAHVLVISMFENNVVVISIRSYHRRSFEIRGDVSGVS